MRSFLLAGWLIVCLLLHGADCPAQNTGGVDERERSTIDRYLKVLLRRPRPGVALDRVYGFHVQNDSLGQLEQALDDPDASDSASRQMVWGLIQLQRGRPAEAVTVLSRAEPLLPDDAGCSFYLGKALLAVGNTEQAAAAMERAIDRNPSRAEALPMFTELGRIYSRAGEREKSLSVWTRLEDLFPGDTRVGGQIARTLAEDGNFEEAKRRYELLARSTRQADEKITFAVEAAEMLRNLGEAEQAVEQLQTILARLRPGSWLYSDVQSRIEAGFTKSGDYDALADYYKTQLDERPDDLAIRTRLARVLIIAGRLNESRGLLESALKQAPDDVEIRLTLIDVLVNQDEIAAASNQFEELANREPDNPDHLMRWGQVVLEDSDSSLEQRRDRAEQIWSRLAEARQDDPVTLSQIADRMRGIDRTEEAIELYRKSIELDPNSPQYREYLGEFLLSLDRKAEAIDVWRSIAAEDRRGRESLVRLAEVFGAFELPGLALETWKEAASFDLTFAQELRYAAKLSEAKRHDESLGRLDKAAAIAETPDEQEQLLRERIAVFQSSGTLKEEIEKLAAEPESIDNLRKLALMHRAAGDLVSGEREIQKALAISPDDPEVLLVAADLAERQYRFADAVTLFQKLAAADSRFRSNYLQRVADLQARLGQTDQAMLTCESIIDANPASPESYLFLARMAMKVNRDEEGIAALRRAMTVAPRDNAPRRMLAAHFAERYRSDEAIALYWQAMNYEAGKEERINLIRSLAPLYDRKNDLDSLIRRIEDFNRTGGDKRTTQLMIAAAFESVQFYGRARQTIEQLLSDQPRDVSLLEMMVRLADAADDVESAAEYQSRITELARTPENRYKLLQYQLESGTIDVREALSERLSLVTDPSRLGRMVRSAVAKGDLRSAKMICQAALRSDASLWDIKLTLAQLLMMDSTSARWGADREQAVKLASEIRQADLTMDEPAPTRGKQPAGGAIPAGRVPVNLQNNPTYWSLSGYQLAQMMRIGPYATRGYSTSASLTVVQPTSFGHARVVGAMLILLNEAIGKSGEDVDQAIEEKIRSEFAIDNIDGVTDPLELWEHYSLLNIAAFVSGGFGNGLLPATRVASSPQARADAEKTRQKTMSLMWRLAEVDQTQGVTPVLSLLTQRMMADSIPPQQRPDTSPLSGKELKTLTSIHRQLQTGASPQWSLPGMPSGAEKTMLQAILAFEFRLAGRLEEAMQFAPEPPGPETDYEQILGAIQFFLRLDRVDRAEALVQHLLPAARRATPSAPVQGFSPQLQMMTGGDSVVANFYADHQNQMVDAAIARECRRINPTPASTVSLGEGFVTAFVQVGSGFRSVRLRGPLSNRLLDSSLVQKIFAFAAPSGSSNSTNPAVNLTLRRELIEHLESPLQGASKLESKTRRVVAAYAHWWDKRPQQCYELLGQLCKDYPADVDLRIEWARLASELDQPRVALEALDSFSPLDSRMLVRKEMAAMNLAAQIGDSARAKRAAERLFGMRLDVQTQLALADQLKRLGLDDQANAVLQRTRTGRTRDERTELQIAQAFMAAGDQDAAAEVAYALLKRLSSGRSRNQNLSYLQGQAVSILKTAGRLEPLIERARRRVTSSPKATRFKMELAELYLAAGQTEEADKVWATLADDVPLGAPQLIARADALTKAGKHSEAVDLYLEAFEKEPSRFQSDFPKLTNAVRMAGKDSIDRLFRRLTEFPAEQIPIYRLDEFVRLGPRGELSDAKRDFLRHILSSSQVTPLVFQMLRNLPADQRETIPEFREAMIQAICSDGAFVNSPSLWDVTSRASGGKAGGSLPDAIQLLQTDEEAAQKFRAAASEALDDPARHRNASFLLALSEVHRADKRDDCLQSIRESILRDADAPPAEPTVTSGLLWQGTQLLESQEEIPIDLLIDLYSEAKRTDRVVSGSGPQFTLDCRLVDTYIKAKRFEEARQHLIKLSRESDFSAQNQYNPGYGDYQQLQADQWAAEKWIACEAYFEALITCRQVLADPDRFERSKRWTGNRNLEQGFEALAEEAESKITPPIAAEHLIREVQSWENDRATNPVNLMEATAESLKTSDSPSSLALALRIAAGEESTRTTVKEFFDRVNVLSKSDPSSWRLAAAELMAALALGLDEKAASARTLFSRLPDLSLSADEEFTLAERSELLVFLDLYPLTRLAKRKGDADDSAIAKQLVTYLGHVAKRSQNSSIAIALAEISGDPAGSIKRILDVIEGQVDSEAVLPESLVQQCLQISKDAAKTGDVKTAARAIKLALQNGPPLRKIGTARNAFAIASSRQTRTSPFTSQTQSELDGLVITLTQLTESLSEATGVALQHRGTPPKQRNHSDPVDAGEMQSIAEAYLAIFAPSHLAGPTFSYAKAIATPTYDRIRADQEIVVSSASMALAIASAHCNRLEATRDLLQELSKTGKQRDEIAIALVQLATVSKDLQQVKESVERFAEVIGDRLPAAETRSSPPPPATSLNSQFVSDSVRKSAVINLVMHAIWPIVDSPLLTDPKTKGHPARSELLSKLEDLVRRTEALIHSDSYTANRHREIRRRLAQKHLSLAKLSGNVKAIESHISAELAAVKTKAYPSGVNLKEYQRRELERTITSLIDEGLTERMGGAFRQWLSALGVGERNDSNRFEPHACMAIARLPAAQQIELLEEVSFGNSAEEPFLYFDGLVSYEIPPDLVHRQHPWLDDALNLPTSTEHYPIVNSFLMLIDTASTLGKTENIRKQLEARTTHPGDQAAIALALLKLAGVETGTEQTKQVLAEIRPTIDAVADRLRRDRPQKNEKGLAFPWLETHLILRAHAAGLSREVTEPMIRDVKFYAIRGYRNFMVSSVARATAKMGIGRAAGATAESPLEHFSVVPIAARYRGDNPRLAPLYKARKDGWISGTSGYDQSHLMFKFPVTGSFTFSAEIQDGAWGEADVAYGGVVYQANGWQKVATLLGMGNRGQVDVDVESIVQGKLNTESLSVSPDAVQGICNGKVYVSDVATHSFPFASVFHHRYRTTQFRNVRFSGRPVIPREVNLIHPTMRGWGVLTRGREPSKMLLPIGRKQDQKKIMDFRNKMEEQLAEGPLVGTWSVVDGKLHYKKEPSGRRTYDPAGQLQYMRPIQEGESIAIEFFWETGKTEFAPTIGRTILQWTQQGMLPDWITANGDLASVGFLPAHQLDPPYQPIAPENLPRESEWNRLTMERSGNRIALTLNDQPLTEIEVAGHERPGLYRREETDVMIRSMKLTGPWPKEFPAELLEQADR